MMKRLSLFLVAATTLVMTGCSSSHRPVYSGHQESTEGVPGFVDGKKVSPHVKLGQSYTVDGETYVPRNQPDYREEGMASWYGPGFHGGKTANGERFDTADLTAAHRTLPLPSIVRVTMLSTGKTVYVRINDRGPFAHSRIIDLSRAAADKIGLIQAGVGKVRVEYLRPETERFVALLAKGRDPKSIDLASEVLDYTRNARAVALASAEQKPAPAATAPATVAAAPSQGFQWQSLNPIRDAAAADSVTVADIPAPGSESAPAAPVVALEAAPETTAAEPAPDTAEESAASPFAAMTQLEPAAAAPDTTVVAQPEPAPPTAPPPDAAPVRPVAAGGYFVQLGAFLKMENAQRMQAQFKAIGTAEIIRKPNARGQVLYHVRMGPHGSEQESTQLLNRVKAAGGNDARVIHED